MFRENGGAELDVCALEWVDTWVLAGFSPLPLPSLVTLWYH